MKYYTRPKWLVGFPCSSVGKESACKAGDLGSIPGLGRSPGERNGNPLQYSCLENTMDGNLHLIYKVRARFPNTGTAQHQRTWERLENSTFLLTCSVSTANVNLLQFYNQPACPNSHLSAHRFFYCYLQWRTLVQETAAKLLAKLIYPREHFIHTRPPM